MRSILFGSVAVLGVAGCGSAQEKAAPSVAQARQSQRPQALRDTVGWRQRMKMNHNADSSIVQQVRRLTKELELTPAQQVKVQQLSKWHNDRIQTILDNAPPTLTYEAFQTEVHAISAQYHDSVNVILTPHQLDLMKGMVGRLDTGRERPRTP